MKFKIEKRDDQDFVVHPDGWARPASADESAMGVRIAELEKALREIARPTDSMDGELQQRIAIAINALMER